MIGDEIVAGAGGDGIGAAVAVDRVGAGAADNGVGARRTGDGERGGQGAGVDVLEIGDCDGVAGRLVRPGADREIDRGGVSGGGENQRVGAATAALIDVSVP